MAEAAQAHATCVRKTSRRRFTPRSELTGRPCEGTIHTVAISSMCRSRPRARTGLSTSCGRNSPSRLAGWKSEAVFLRNGQRIRSRQQFFESFEDLRVIDKPGFMRTEL